MRSIRGLLFPQEKIFFELLERESKNVLEGAILLEDLTRKFDNRTASVRAKVKEVEHKGDKIVKEIHQRLNLSFITPIDHEDISGLSTSYDEVLDYIYSVVNRLFVYNIRRIDEAIRTLSKIVLLTCQEIDQAFVSMKKLSQVEMDKHFVRVHELEREADEILDSATARLFKKKNLVQILKYKELYEILEGTTDRCEDVVDILRGIVLKHA